MRRREFIAGLGSVVAWPAVARAQQGDRVRRIGVLMWGDENLAKARISAFTQALADLGWTDGSNLRIDLRRDGGDANRMPALARELVSLQSEIILTNTTLTTVALQRETRTIRAALGDRARAQAGRNHVQSRHRPRCIDVYALT
jgi:putative ABC transport system substrate-binding protein